MIYHKYMTLDGVYEINGIVRSLFERGEVAQVAIDENDKIVDLIISPVEILSGNPREGVRKFNKHQEKLRKKRDENIIGR